MPKTAFAFQINKFWRHFKKAAFIKQKILHFTSSKLNYYPLFVPILVKNLNKYSYLLRLLRGRKLPEMKPAFH